MPSQTTSWITKHDNLAVLHVTSTDPRRAGAQELALFEADLLPILSPYSWRVRHGQIENTLGKSLLGIITGVRRKGTTQIEPNCDFTIANLAKRPSPVVYGTSNLETFKANTPDWRDVVWKAKNGCELFHPMRYRSRDEWTTLTIALSDGGTLDIKVNKWLVSSIPTKMVYRPARPFNQLYLLPNRAQIKRPRYDNDRRHGQALTAYILTLLDSNVTASRLRDRFDYRVNQAQDFIQSCNPKNDWFHTAQGWVLKVTYPEGYCRHSWDQLKEHVYPKLPVIPRRAERVGYFLVSETIADVAKDFSWIMDENEAVCSSFDYQNLKGKRFRLARLVCELSGLAVSGVVVPARLTKYYEAALANTDNKSLHRRAKFENSLSSENSTSNRMYVQSKFISKRRLHLLKYEAIPELNITALDLRIEGIRVGGSIK